MLRYNITFAYLLLLASDCLWAAVELEAMTVSADEAEPGTPAGEWRRSANLGEALGTEPGIANQSFGPGVGRPVMRGQGGNRVRLLENGLGTGDLTALSPDHAVTLEPSLAERIDVLRGPSTLEYGSGLVGGVANVRDGRIPENLPGSVLNAAVRYRFDSTRDGHTGTLRMDARLDPFVLHLDGLRSSSGDLRTGRGVLDHTGGDRRSGSAGLYWIGEQGFIGAAVSQLDNTYGVPGFEPVPIDIDLHQTRYDLRAGWLDPVAGVELLRLAFGYRDYHHDEIEAGVRGTRWTRENYECRLLVRHHPLGDWSGRLGFQARHTRLRASGDEAILPRTETDSHAGFWLERWQHRPFRATLALRLEHQHTHADGHRPREDFLTSGAFEIAWRFHDRHRLSFAYTTTERAPQAEERYVFGGHTATQSFEIGDPNLRPERSHQLELGYRFQNDRLEATLTLFQYWIQDYIFFQARGDRHVESGLPIFTATQEDASFRGFEAQVRLPLAAMLDLRLFGDLTRGRLARGGDVPRMPPLRYGAEIDWYQGGTSLYGRLIRAEPQNHPGRLEPSTPGYVRLDLGGEYRLSLAGGRHLTLFARGVNLLDQTIRLSTSFLRTIAPEAGRGVQAGIELEL